MIKKIKKNIWQFSFVFFGSCVYVIKLKGKNIVIDTSSFVNRPELKKSLRHISVNPDDVSILLLTHNHFDHTGNIKLFKNSKIYGGGDFKNKKILNLRDLKIKEIIIIKTPGHTAGSICFYLPKEKILFSGDTLFDRGFIGRTDLPNSRPEKMKSSLGKLKKLGYKILCPGHLL